MTGTFVTAFNEKYKEEINSAPVVFFSGLNFQLRIVEEEVIDLSWKEGFLFFVARCHKMAHRLRSLAMIVFKLENKK